MGMLDDACWHLMTHQVLSGVIKHHKASPQGSSSVQNIALQTVFRQGWTLFAQGCPNFEKKTLVLQYMKKLRSSPFEPLVIRVCQKCQKGKNSEKIGFWGNFGYISKRVKSIFMIFWHKTPLNINKRIAK